MDMLTSRQTNSAPRGGHSTIGDVAQKAGVSIATVSRVLNQTVKVSDDTAIRVHRAIAELSYVPQTAARNLARRKTNTIGLLLPDIASDFFFPILRGSEIAARQAGFDLLIAIQPLEALRGKNDANLLGSHNTDGLLVFAGDLDEETLAHLPGPDFPMVLLYHSAPQGSNITSIVVENRNGARRLVEHLIEVHHCRRIVFLRGPDGNEDSQWRELGYRLALSTHHLEFDECLIATGGFEEAQGRAAVEGLRRQGIQFDAIFAGDDDTAIGCLSALAQAGLRVPQDVALVGFDDMTPARYLNPPLTTVRAPTEQVGREAVQQLVRRIHCGQAEPMVLLPTELIIRQSCGCK
jgi:DNA-binding LacI/PurR family transcriptional regulator